MNKLHGKPKDSDRCQTPDYGTDTIIPYIKDGSVIWEPACGEELMSNRLSKKFKVIATDIINGQDFFNTNVDFDCIVSNPPYSLKKEWTHRCLELNKPFALLMPLETLGTKWCWEVFKKYNMSLILLNKRINFKMPFKKWEGGGSQFAVAWFCFNMETKDQIEFQEVITGGEKNE